MDRHRPLHENLARYMDNEAFVAKRIGREKAEKFAVRRMAAKKRSKAAIAFFVNHPEQLHRLLSLAAARHSQIAVLPEEVPADATE